MRARAPLQELQGSLAGSSKTPTVLRRGVASRSAAAMPDLAGGELSRARFGMEAERQPGQAGAARARRYAVLVDGVERKGGSLFEDFEPAINPPEEVDDPDDSKPSSWVDTPKCARLPACERIVIYVCE